jgi:predicted RNA polymerase sigma factor
MPVPIEPHVQRGPKAALEKTDSYRQKSLLLSFKSATPAIAPNQRAALTFMIFLYELVKTSIASLRALDAKVALDAPRCCDF